MPCVKRKLLALAFVALTTFLPKVSFAETTSCECFCGAVGVGAEDKKSSTPDACLATCTKDKQQYVGCFTDPSEYPVESDKCWTKTECSQWSENRGGENITADWGAVVPFDCSKTKTSGEEMRYCYAKDTPYNLNVVIGSTTKVGNLPTYINAIYAWLLPAASLVAVVMMMIGGLQYVMARGKSKYIDAAKTRITNAITGLVLLLSAYVLLNLVDPRFTRFQSLQVPLIKQVVMLDPTSSCERLEDYGYTIGPATTSAADGSALCGGKGKITSVDGLKDNALGSWKLNDLCDYQKCSITGTSCVSTESGNFCFACSANQSPSEGSCALLEKEDPDRPVYCRYDATDSIIASSGSFTGGACYGVQNEGSGLSEQYLNCRLAKDKAAKSTEYPACKYYETLKISRLLDNREINTEQYAGLLQEICEDDPCGLAPSGSRCGYNTGAKVETDFFGLYTSTTPGYFCNTFKQ